MKKRKREKNEIINEEKQQNEEKEEKEENKNQNLTSTSLISSNSELKTSVCNVKVSFIRPKYLNLKEWMLDSNNIYIGRKGIVFIDNQRFPKHDSLWNNPFKIGKDGSREVVLKKFETYIKNRLKNESNLKEELLKLKYKNLGCWCTSRTEYYPCCNEIVCHGQILMNLIYQESDINDYNS